MNTQHPRKVFLSYGRDDAGELALMLEHELEQRGHRVWLDKRQITSGSSWEEQIEAAILDCEIFLSLLTPHAVRRPDGVCLDEISMARFNNRRILPAMVMQCRPPLGIFRLDWIDFQGWQNPAHFGKALERLLAAFDADAGVDGAHARIFASLKPLDFSAELARLARGFTGREWMERELQQWLDGHAIAHQARRESQALLEITESGNTRRFQLAAGSLCSIGRSADNAVVIIDPQASRHHAYITSAGNGFRIVDGATDNRRSTNGITVNGNRVDEHQLAEGDRIRIGATEILFRLARRTDREDRSRVFLVTGDPGTGKSAALAHFINRHPQVGAYHFCVSSLVDSLDPVRFVRSIAAQLATQLEDYRGALAAVELEQMNDADAGVLLRRIVADPLRTIPEPRQPVLIAVDALDEALGHGARNIVRLLSERIADMPPWILLLSSSRNEPEILDLLSGFRPHEVDAARHESLDDISAYIDNSLRETHLAELLSRSGVDPVEFGELMRQKSAGNFLYATQAILALRSGRLDPRHPETFPDGLIGVYRDFFDRLFADGERYANFRPILDVIVAAREPLTASLIGAFLDRDGFDVGKDLEQVAAFFPERDGAYQPFHKSITDWLRGAGGGSRRYQVNVEAGHRAIARYLDRKYETGDRSRFTLAHLPAHAFALRDRATFLRLVDRGFLAEKARRFPEVVLEDVDLLTRVLLDGDDPAAIDECASELDGLRDIIGKKTMDAAGGAPAAVRKQTDRPAGAIVAAPVASVQGLDVFGGVVIATPSSDVAGNDDSSSYLQSQAGQSIVAYFVPPRQLSVDEVAADILEVVGLGERLLLLIGDAPFVGLKSALAARFIGGLFRRLAADSPWAQPAELIAAVRSTFQAHGEFPIFSLQCAVVDPRARRVTCATAGHPAPVLYSAGSGSSRVLSDSDQQTEDLGPGDVLAFVTSGLIGDEHAELRSRFSFLKRLEELASRPAREIGQAILEDWCEHHGHDRLPDDATVVVMAVTE